ncbi:LLM class flavin-dependent oxidoreductase [Streptomyces sp. NBC_01803]|uniref:LLM class flavin-dependent oxidoreductase n=1 Tax=Streptomyces sp. NBC_01803 TaxID=2975946 RepID=UPI002DD83607|nr:LLM class flavin-dependent oxidoreductase [Streptomyces sp. NBC_01803]WSA47287.1 LLM class flavin-dependent oxidoreductase [Streptomyces sp. NBC_01803]
MPPQAAAPDGLVQLAQLADGSGLELFGLMDHPHQGAVMDSWSTLAVIAARTRRVRLFPDVAHLPLRPPAVLAKAAATVDLLSGGRVELGIGAGAVEGRQLGAPELTPGEAVAALAEGIDVIRLMWTPGDAPVDYPGTHHRLVGAEPGPAPAHPISIWVGAYQPRMLSLTGRLADGWLPSYPFVDPAGLPALNKRVDEAAYEAGRQPGDVRRLYNIMGSVTPGGKALFNEGPETWIERLTELVLTCGVSALVLAPVTDPARQIQVYAEEIAPAVREAVARG